VAGSVNEQARGDHSEIRSCRKGGASRRAGSRRTVTRCVSRGPIAKPILRFEYSFDAEVLDPDLRGVLAGDVNVDVSVAPFMADVRSRIESALAATPGLRVGEIGLSGLHCSGVAQIPETVEIR
jgi:hypothetical protein